METDNLYVRHVLEAIEKIEKFVSGYTLDSFIKDELAQSAVIREVSVIGEAASKLSEEFEKSHSGVPWKKVIGMRHKLIHDYFEVDVNAVWKTVKEDLVSLKQELSK